MNEQIGATAGNIWKVLNKDGELSVGQLKKKIGSKGPVFDWAVGWLAREGKITISSQKRTTTIRLK